MYELQTLSDFIKNPLGKGTSILPNRDLIVDDFKRRKKIMEGEGKKFPVAVYKNDVKGTYLFHVLVPSETKRENNYDVIFELVPPEKKGFNGKVSLDKYLVRFFSNSPSFVFTYANIMYSNGMGIKMFAKKYSKEILTKAPEVRNPTGTILYEKSIMFAALTLLDNPDYFTEAYVNNIAKKNADNALFAKVRTHETILEEIKKEQNRLSIEKREDKKQFKETQREKSREVKRLAGIKTNRRIDPKQSTSSSRAIKKKEKNVAKKSTRRK